MTLAERVYRLLLRLYPKEHRRAYAQPMLQHARDLGRDARARGSWQSVVMTFRLLKDGIVNAGIEHMEAIMLAKNSFKPASWSIVLLACIPGLLVAFSRRPAELLDSVLPILGYLYLALLVIALPVIWWRRRRFPVWALLPAGALAWVLTYMAGIGLAQLVNSLRIPDLKWMEIWTGITIVHFLLAAVLFLVLLRGQGIPRSVWLVVGIIALSHLLLAALYSLARYGGDQPFAGILTYFTQSGLGPFEGLMLVAVGLLFARQHGTLALLVVVGGYFYMFTDSDYLSGFLLRDWGGLAVYLGGAAILFLVVVPVALLRARTRLGRVLAVFVPLVAFHVIRLIVPAIVLGQPLDIRLGETVAFINMVLILILAWVLFSHFGESTRPVKPNQELEKLPLPS